MEENLEPKKSFIRRFWLLPGPKWIWILILVLILFGASTIITNTFKRDKKIEDVSNKKNEGNSKENDWTNLTEIRPKTCPEIIENSGSSTQMGVIEGVRYRIEPKDLDWIKQYCPAFQQTADQSTSQNKEGTYSWPSKTAKYISAVPVDLTQIQAISKYRSCSGHDRSGYSFEQNLEADRSMKHYLFPVPAYQGTIDKVKIFAPFDGRVSKLEMDDGKAGKRDKSGNGISFSTTIDPNVAFGFGHIYFVKDFRVGDEVKAGELIGYAALGNKGYDFDIDLMSAKRKDTEVLGSFFDHMTDSVSAEFAKYGITPDNTKFTKEDRDTQPCNYAAGGRVDNRSGEGWVKLIH